MGEGAIMNSKINLSEPLNFKHYISLGYSCYIAMELEDLFLRDSSYPFDWIESTLIGVEECIKNNFDGFLKYEDLFQLKKYHHAYRNTRYGFSFLHDFKRNYSLKSQLKGVQKKYDRRIKRFYKSISEPTMFFRYIQNSDELSFLNKNHKRITDFLKSFCDSNEIIYICQDLPCETEVPNVFFVEKDPGEKLTHHPLSQNKRLREMLTDAWIPGKEENVSFEIRKKYNKSKRPKGINYLKFRVCRFIEKHIFKDYIHYQQC